MKSFADVIDEGKIIGGAIDNTWENFGKFGGLANDGWYYDSNEGTNKSDDKDI